MVCWITLAKLPRGKGRARIDWLGTGLLTVWITSLVLIATWGGTEYAWASPQILGLIALTLAGLAAFIAVERRQAEPIMPLRVFRNRNFVLAGGIAFISGFALFGAIGYLPQYQQFVQGASATNSGLLLMPMMIAVMAVSLTVGQVISRTGRYRIFPIIGAVLVAAGMFLFSTVDVGTSPTTTAIYMVILGAGMGGIMQTSTLIAQNSLDLRDMGAGTGVSTFLRNMGSSLGVSILGAIYAHHLTDFARPPRQPTAGFGLGVLDDPGRAAGPARGGPPRLPAGGHRRHQRPVPLGQRRRGPRDHRGALHPARAAARRQAGRGEDVGRRNGTDRRRPARRRRLTHHRPGRDHIPAGPVPFASEEVAIVPSAPRIWLRRAALAGLFALFAIELKLGWPSLSSALKQLHTSHPGWIAAALAAEVMAMGAYARMQRRLLRSAGLRVPLQRHLALAFAAHSLNETLPGGPAFPYASTSSSCAVSGPLPRSRPGASPSPGCCPPPPWPPSRSPGRWPPAAPRPGPGSPVCSRSRSLSRTGSGSSPAARRSWNR